MLNLRKDGKRGTRYPIVITKFSYRTGFYPYTEYVTLAQMVRHVDYYVQKARKGVRWGNRYATNAVSHMNLPEA